MNMRLLIILLPHAVTTVLAICRHYPPCPEGRGISSGAGCFSNSGDQKELLESADAGLKGEYFNNQIFHGNPFQTIIDPIIDFASDGTPFPTPSSSNVTNFISMKWSGFILPKFDEVYDFHIIVRGGVRLWVNDDLLLNESSADEKMFIEPSKSTLYSGKLSRIVIEYQGNIETFCIKLEWKSPSQSLELIPKSSLFHKCELSQAQKLKVDLTLCQKHTSGSTDQFHMSFLYSNKQNHTEKNAFQKNPPLKPTGEYSYMVYTEINEYPAALTVSATGTNALCILELTVNGVTLLGDFPLWLDRPCPKEEYTSGDICAFSYTWTMLNGPNELANKLAISQHNLKTVEKKILREDNNSSVETEKNPMDQDESGRSGTVCNNDVSKQYNQIHNKLGIVLVYQGNAVSIEDLLDSAASWCLQLWKKLWE